MLRTRTDRCPGVLRPWPAEDGPLVRVRLPGGRLTAAQLVALADVAEEHADGDLHLTSRANVQLRAVRDAARLADALEASGLLPSRPHDLVRNLACSPFTGLRGGRADLRPLLADLDTALLVDAGLTVLPGKFLLALDDGTHDVIDGADLAAVAIDRTSARVLVGGLDAGTIPLDEAVDRLLGLARTFVDVRGTGDDAPWHVRELPDRGRELVGDRPAHGLRPAVTSPDHGTLPQDDGGALLHLSVADGVLGSPRARELAARAARGVVITPWRSLVLPGAGGPAEGAS